MSMFYKVMAALLLTLPVGAYVAGAQVGSSDHSPQTRLVRSDQPSPRDDRAAPTVTPRPSAPVDRGPAQEPATTEVPDEAQHQEHSDHEDGDHGSWGGGGDTGDQGSWGGGADDHGHEGGDEH